MKFAIYKKLSCRRESARRSLRALIVPCLQYAYAHFGLLLCPLRYWNLGPKWIGPLHYSDNVINAKRSDSVDHSWRGGSMSARCTVSNGRLHNAVRYNQFSCRRRRATNHVIRYIAYEFLLTFQQLWPIVYHFRDKARRLWKKFENVLLVSIQNTNVTDTALRHRPRYA